MSSKPTRLDLCLSKDHYQAGAKSTMRTIRIRPQLPEVLAPLQEIAYNLHWAWVPDAVELFRRLDRDLWESTGHNPIAMIGAIPQHRLQDLAEDGALLAHIERVQAQLHDYLGAGAWFQHAHAQEKGLMVAYFSMEFGLHECLPNYSGGLGVLSGDHLKSSSDLGIPLVGVGLLYQQGYFRQYLNADGWQGERYPENDFYNMPLLPALTPSGAEVKVTVEFPGRKVSAKVWRVQVGRTPLYLLDTNIADNNREDQDITDQLYGGDREMRIKQEIVLGIGGLRALSVLGLRPNVFHINEGHAAFLGFERTRMLMQDAGLPYHQAVEVMRAANVFTTHTPVPAGFDMFSRELIAKYFAEPLQQVGLSVDAFMNLGRARPNGDEPLNMAIFAMRHASLCNGVSKLHGKVSREMFRNLWADFPTEEVPIGHVTNGIHTRSWIAPGMAQLLNRHLGPAWLDDPTDYAVWDRILDIPDEELWRARTEQREELVHFARQHFLDQLTRGGAPEHEIKEAGNALASHCLTIGFARRFAGYKRATLLLRNPERLRKLLLNEERPVQIIVAGKAHPRDDEAKDLIRRVVQFRRDPQLRHRFVFLEDYDMNVARYLVQGCDVWLNNPRRPHEASGTSGMKVVPNGGLNLSILDGWWDEGYEAGGGWAIGHGENYEDLNYQDTVESNALYELLENDVVPAFYSRLKQERAPSLWVARMKQSMRRLCPVFNTNRMVVDYLERYYLPASWRYRELIENAYGRGKDVITWRERVKARFHQVAVEDVSSLPAEAKVGDKIPVRAFVRLGDLTPKDVMVQVYHGPLDAQSHLRRGLTTEMRWVREEGGRHLYEVDLPCSDSGLYGYTVRVLPAHQHVLVPSELDLVAWAAGQRW
jgi:starch phosphorylase